MKDYLGSTAMGCIFKLQFLAGRHIPKDAATPSQLEYQIAYACQRIHSIRVLIFFLIITSTVGDILVFA